MPEFLNLGIPVISKRIIICFGRGRWAGGRGAAALVVRGGGAEAQVVSGVGALRLRW